MTDDRSPGARRVTATGGLGALKRLVLTPVATRTGDTALAFSAAATTFVAAAYGLTQLMFVTSGHLGPTRATVLLVAALICAAVAAAAFVRQRAIVTTLVLAIVIAAATFVSDHVLDISYDGQDYHYSAIWALADGWNPFYTSFYQHTAPGSDAEIWAPFFPKGVWIYNAVWVSAGVTYEAAKTQNILLAAAVATGVYGAAIRHGWRTFAAVVVAVLAAANPIAISELFTRMNDGTIAALATLFLLFAGLTIADRDWRAGTMALIVLILAINTKQSGMLIFAMLCAGLCLIAWLARGIRFAVVGGITLMATAVFALFFVGADPYLRNILMKGNIVYPMRGAPEIVINDEYRPPALLHRSDPVRLALSMIGETSYEGPVLKLPFTVTPDEFTLAGDPEVFLGGMGPWFSGVALLALAGLGALAAARPGWRSAPTLLAIAGVTAAAASFVMPESWSMRYVPHLWLWPLLTAAALLALRRYTAIAALILAAMSVNAAIAVASTVLRQGEASRVSAEQLARLRAAGGHYAADPGASPARLALLRDHGISAEESEGMPAGCRSPEPMVFAHPYNDDETRPGMICRLPDRGAAR